MLKDLEDPHLLYLLLDLEDLGVLGVLGVLEGQEGLVGQGHPEFQDQMILLREEQQNLLSVQQSFF
jgi:hypothetical protein